MKSIFSKLIVSLVISANAFWSVFTLPTYADVIPNDPYDLSIQKTIIATDLIWSTITYKISYTNSGNVTLSWMYLRDFYDTGLVFKSVLSSTPDLNWNDIIFSHLSDQHMLQWQSIVLWPNATWEAILMFDIVSWTLSTGITNTIKCGVSDGTCTPNTRFTWSGGWNATVFVQPKNNSNQVDSPAPYDLTIDKTANMSLVINGDIVEYTITYTNNNPEPKNDIYLEDVFLSNDFSFDSVVSSSPSVWNPSIVNSNDTPKQTRLIWRNLSLGPNSSGTIVLRFIVKTAHTDMQNTGKVWSTALDGTFYIQGGLSLRDWHIK